MSSLGPRDGDRLALGQPADDRHEPVVGGAESRPAGGRTPRPASARTRTPPTRRRPPPTSVRRPRTGGSRGRPRRSASWLLQKPPGQLARRVRPRPRVSRVLAPTVRPLRTTLPAADERRVGDEPAPAPAARADTRPTSRSDANPRTHGADEVVDLEQRLVGRDRLPEHLVEVHHHAGDRRANRDGRRPSRSSRGAGRYGPASAPRSGAFAGAPRHGS